MKAWTIFVALFLLGVASPLFAAKNAALQPVLPQSFGAWTITGTDALIAPESIEQVAGQKASALREYGITSAEHARYSQGSQTSPITLYRMTDPTAAFGAFTLLRDPAMTRLTLGPSVAYAAHSNDHVLLVVGNFLLDVPSNAALPGDSDLKALADGLRPKSDHAPYPLIPGFLPKGFITNSDLYVLGPMEFAQAFPIGNVNQKDWLGFDKSGEAIIAHYHLDGQPQGKEALLMLALYPTQQVAADEYKGFNGWIELNPPAGTTNGLPAVYGKRSGPLVALVAGADSKEAANTLLDKIQYSSQVTWDEPTHELTDPNIGTIVVGAIMGTGAIMLLAVVAGLGFGGLRLFLKVLLPGKVFDRQDKVEILQLGITSKPIESMDVSRRG